MGAFEELKSILIETRGIDSKKIVDSATFDSLGLDSLDAVDILMTVEDKLKIKLDIEDNLKTLGDVVKMIDKAKK